MRKLSSILIASFLISWFTTTHGAEGNKRYPIRITNSSAKHVGVDVNGVLFLLRCNNQNCPDCRSAAFGNQVSLGVSGPTKIKCTYGSFKSLSRKGYNLFPELPKNAFIAIESALLVTTAFGAAGYSFPVMQEMLKKTAQRFVGLGNGEAQATALRGFCDIGKKAYEDPYIVGAISAGQNITQGNVFGVLWNVITFENARQRDAFIQSVTEQAAKNSDMGKVAQEKLTNILKKESVTTGWWKKVTTIDPEKIKAWQDEFGHKLSLEDLDNLMEEKLANAPREALAKANALGKSSLETIAESSKYYAGEAARYAVENPQMACLYIAGAAAGATVVVGGYYLWTCGDECVVTPDQNQEHDLVTLVNIYDGTIYGVQMGTSFQTNN